MNKSYIIPFNKRNKTGFGLAVTAALIFGAAMVMVWCAVVAGAHDVNSILITIAITACFGCSLIAAITGRLEWILLGYWLPY